MKKVEAFIRAEKLEEVKKALLDAGVRGMSVYEVRGRGEKAGIELEYRGHVIRVDLLPRVKVEVVVEDHMVDRVVETIMRAARTGREGDGRIFVLPVLEAYRIRTGEKLSNNTHSSGQDQNQ